VKIVLDIRIGALILIAPFMKIGNISDIAIFITIGLLLVGLYFTNKGAKGE